ncbi:MAG TPA: magnesium transporter [Miltoncostaeaceae bacterium]|nr:magnesium transporter [Miltoncostaeaceae bacterium]
MTDEARALRDRLETRPPAEMAEELVRLPAQDQAMAVRLLPKERALAVFEALDPAHQQALLDALRDEEVVRMVEEMDPDDRVRLLDEMPAGLAHRLLQGLSEDERRMTSALLGYPESSAGRIMSPEVLHVGAAMTVEEALAHVRRGGRDAETVNLLPVTDGGRVLVGTLGLADLVLAPEGTRVGDVMAHDPPSVMADRDQEEAARMFERGDLIALPVVDHERRLLGVITVDDAVRVLRIEATEDQARAGGAEPLGRPYLSSSPLRMARSRATWLLLLVVAATLTVNVLEAFEGTLAQVVTLAVFIPLLIGTGGNAGAQVSTTIVRALALGEVRPADIGRVLWREVRVGLMLGSILAALALTPVWIAYDRDIAVVIAITLLGIVTWAGIVGATLPFAARRLGIDPALVSAPVVTTLVDATGLIIYFLVAEAVLGI